MHKSRKWLSLLLCLAMLVSAVPVQVFAIGEETGTEPAITNDVQAYTETTGETGVPAEETGESTEAPGTEPSGESEEPDEEPSEEERVSPLSDDDIVSVTDDKGVVTGYESLKQALTGVFGGGIYTYGGTYVFTLLGDTDYPGDTWNLGYPEDGKTVNLTIDLNGHTIQGVSSAAVLGFNFGKIPGTLTIQDSVGTGKITGGKQGVVFMGKDSVLNFNGGTITGNHGGQKGGGIYSQDKTTLNLNGGVITGNSVTGSAANTGLGGGVCANKVNVNGTIVTGNEAIGGSNIQTGRGGGLAIEITGTTGYNVVTINANTIYGNTATNAGDDLMIAKNGLSGTKHTLVIGTENWYIDGWNGVSISKGQTARYSAENPVPYTDGGFTDEYKINLGLKYVAPAAPVTYTVTYTDGVEEAVAFADQTYTVKENDATPAFDGPPTRKGYVFDGWDPEVAETVTEDVTYTATWAECTHTWDNGVYDGDVQSVIYTCTVCGETKTMDAVAQVKGTGVYYETLQEAIDAADNDTVLILKDLALTAEISVRNTVTLTADGAVTLTRAGTKDLFGVYANASLTVEGPVTMVGSTKYGTMVNVLKSGTFVMNEGVTIKDNIMGKIGYAGGVTVTDGTFIMNGGTIDNCGNTGNGKPGSQNGGTMGGGVRIIASQNGTVAASFTMNGGSITNCSCYLGGGIGLENKGSKVPASVTIYNGTISGCSSSSKSANYRGGAAIYIYNRTKSLEDATVTMYGGTITGNTANSNAALCMYTGTNSTQTYGGKFYILGGTITGNVSGNGNPSSGYGNGVYLERLVGGKPLLTVGGSAVIDDDILLKSSTGNYFEILDGFTGSVKVYVQAGGTGSEAENYYGTLVAKQVSATGVASTATKAVAKGIVAVYPFTNSDGKVYEHPSYDIVLSDTATDAYVLGEYPDTFTVTYTDGVENEVVFEDQTFTVENGETTPAFDGTPTREGFVFTGWTPEVTQTVTEDVTYTAQWMAVVARLESSGACFVSLQDALDAAEVAVHTGEGSHRSQTVTLLADVTECVSVEHVSASSNSFDYDLTIDLNGHTVTGDGSGAVFTVARSGYASKSVNVNVIFADSVGTGVITGGKGTNGGAIFINSKKNITVVINGGTITGNTATNGGAIGMKSGNNTNVLAVIVNGGTITGNTATGNGGAIFAGIVTVNGGIITGNTAANGGGVYVNHNSKGVKLEMTGGKLYGNTATTAGDDIYWYAVNGNSTNTLLKLVDPASMAVEGIVHWCLDGADSRYSAENAVAFDEFAGYTETKNRICLKAAAESAPAAPEKWGNNVMKDLVKTLCDSDPDHVSVTSDWSAVNCQVFPTGSTPVWDAELGAWTIGIRIQQLTVQYVAKLEKANNKITHELVGESLMLATLKWDKTQQLWVTLDGQPLEVHATCQTKPAAPVFGQLSSFQIQVYGQVGFESKLYAINLNADSVTVGEVQGNRDDGFTVDVTVAIAEDDAYQSGWLAQCAPEKTLADYTYDWAKTPATITFTLKYTGDLNGTLYGNRNYSGHYDWVLASSGKHFGKVGEAYLIPAKPAAPVQANVTDELVKIICDSDPDRHGSAYGKWYPTCCKTLSDIVWNDELNAWIVDVKIDSLYMSYVRQFERANNNVTHELLDDTTSVYATLKWDVTAQQWVPTESIELHTTCRTVPLLPVYSQLEAYQIKVRGDVDGNGVYGEKGETWTTSIPENGYTLSEVRGSREEGFYVDVTVELTDGDLYQTRWIEKCDPAHFYKYNWDKTEKTVTFTLRYNGSLTGTLYGNRNAANTNYDWVLDTTGKTWGVIAEAQVDKVMCTVQIQIYRNGDTTKPYKTVTLDKVAKGDTLDLSGLNISDYYSSSNGYEFEGWFNDGRWNQYKAGQTVTGMDEIAINGWTNIICMVTDYQVVQLQIYRNGDTTKPYQTVQLDKMLKGDTLDLTELDIHDYYTCANGFDFFGWFNDGRWNDYKAGKTPAGLDEITVNGWTNVICMVNDCQKVVVKAVTNGNKDDAQVIFTGTAPLGADLNEWLNSNVTVPEKSGYTLAKWYNWDWYGHKYEDGRTVNGWTNVYVTYTGISATVTLDPNGGSVDPTSITVTYGEPIGELPVPTRQGHTFLGWIMGRSEEHDTQPDYVTKDTVYTLTEDATLIARWRANTYTLTLDEGTGKTQIKTVTFGEAVGKLPVPVRDGYRFGGWVDADGNKVTENTLYTVVNDSTWNAVWEKETPATTTPSDSESPKTGDSAIVYIFAIMMMCAVAVTVLLTDRKRSA